MSRQKTIFFDCSATLFSGLNTGIQRVVRNIIRRQPLMEHEFGIKVTPVVSVMGSFYEVDPTVILNARPITASFGTRVRTLFEKVKRRILTRVPWPAFFRPLIEVILNIIEWLLKKIFWVIKFLRVLGAVFFNQSPPIQVGPHDTLVLLDAFWQFNLSHSIKKSKARDVVTVMYDLVPVYHGEFVEEVNRKRFLSAMPWMLSLSHRFLCISHDVEIQLRRYCGQQGIKGKNFDHFFLGSDFSPKLTADLSALEIRPGWDAMFANAPVWLVVGTIEPRKNHSMVLDAFDLLWKEGAEDKLLIVGRIGWKTDELIDRILKHPEYNQKLFFKWDANDTELFYAYQKSAGLIFSSFAEGFGLPLVEAMASQIKVVCSDIPIFREVGGDYPIYFSLVSPKNLVDGLKQAKSLPSPKAVKWPSWDDSVRCFIGKILGGHQ